MKIKWTPVRRASHAANITWTLAKGADNAGQKAASELLHQLANAASTHAEIVFALADRNENPNGQERHAKAAEACQECAEAHLEAQTTP